MFELASLERASTVVTDCVCNWAFLSEALLVSSSVLPSLLMEHVASARILSGLIFELELIPDKP